MTSAVEVPDPWADDLAQQGEALKRLANDQGPRSVQQRSSEPLDGSTSAAESIPRARFHQCFLRNPRLAEAIAVVAPLHDYNEALAMSHHTESPEAELDCRVNFDKAPSYRSRTLQIRARFLRDRQDHPHEGGLTVMRAALLSFALAGLVLVPASAEAIDGAAWLLAPLSGATEHHIEVWTAWHARLMVLAWGVLLPLGAMVARFFKVRPHQAWPEMLDDKAWWHSHRLLQWAGVLVMCVGVMLAWDRGSGVAMVARIHARIGYTLCSIGIFQMASGLLRGSKGGPTDVAPHGDHYDMTRRRVAFERLHKVFGWAAILVAMAEIVLGLASVDAPRWMLVMLLSWWGAIGGAFIRWQCQGRCIDTYQAIWGPDPSHPGNRLSPIGLGVHRYTAVKWRARFGPH